MVGIVATKQWRISSEYGWRNHPIFKKRKFHKGVDIACPAGTPILSPAGGIVTRKEYMRGYGNVVYVKHPDGTETRYAHMRNFANIQPGMQINQGDVLGYVGSTGHSTGPHLHFEMRDKNGNPLNPQDVFGNDFTNTSVTQPETYVPWEDAEKIRNNEAALLAFQNQPLLPEPTWLQRNFPPPIGWSIEQLQQYDYQQELQREVFRGVTVGELKVQGLSDEKIQQLQDLNDKTANAVLAGNSEGNITFNEIQQVAGADARVAVANAVKNDHSA